MLLHIHLLSDMYMGQNKVHLSVWFSEECWSSECYAGGFCVRNCISVFLSILCVNKSVKVA